MTSLFHFEEKIHRKHLNRVKTIPLLFPRLLSHVLEHLVWTLPDPRAGDSLFIEKSELIFEL